MPKLNRRRFLQVFSAAGLAPAMPALAASATTTTA
ncbi:MAG TPA: Tat pathway signal sequence domain protein, partial [Sulfitobacter sp.]|nr:Tat pathway signal sequence domain protein [Sulfitobacter sp.]